MRAQRVTFPGSCPFHVELKRRVGAYFEGTRVSPHDNLRMYLKSAVILAWLVGSYALLVFGAVGGWQAGLLAVSLGLSVAGVGFNIQHDANHGGYSGLGPVNRALAMTLDLVGGSSYVWHWKHNVFHHTYTNIAGMDADIDVEPISRFAPSQTRRFLHRYQHLYAWVLYGMLPVKWHFFDDFRDLASARIGKQRFPRPGAAEVAILVAGKVVFFTLAFVVPAFLHPLWAVLAIYGVASFTLGIVLSVTFQLAHCVGEADFPTAGEDHRMAQPWAVHQVETTVDFARANRLLGWFLGGLNFQVEHHLFPKVCHVHYAALSRIVEDTCREYGVRYRAHATLGAALASHARWLFRLGRPVVGTLLPSV